MNLTLNIKPLSVNSAWRGKRYKTHEYKQFERDCLFMLPAGKIESFHKVTLTFGFSSILADLDNPAKLIIDILQKKYDVNDRDLQEIVLKRVTVPKGSEFIKIEI